MILIREFVKLETASITMDLDCEDLARSEVTESEDKTSILEMTKQVFRYNVFNN